MWRRVFGQEARRLRQGGLLDEAAFLLGEVACDPEDVEAVASRLRCLGTVEGDQLADELADLGNE